MEFRPIRYQEPTLPQGVTPDQDARSNFDYGGGQLPRGVIFNQSDVMADTRSQALDEEGGGPMGQIRPRPSCSIRTERPSKRP